jgi:hypothetical protein
MGVSPFQRRFVAIGPVMVMAGLTLACADDAVDASAKFDGGLEASHGGVDSGAIDGNRVESDAFGKATGDAAVSRAADAGDTGATPAGDAGLDVAFGARDGGADAADSVAADH